MSVVHVMVLMRSREFIMKDAYSFDVDEAGLDEIL